MLEVFKLPEIFLAITQDGLHCLRNLILDVFLDAIVHEVVDYAELTLNAIQV